MKRSATSRLIWEKGVESYRLNFTNEKMKTAFLKKIIVIRKLYKSNLKAAHLKLTVDLTRFVNEFSETDGDTDVIIAILSLIDWKFSNPTTSLYLNEDIYETMGWTNDGCKLYCIAWAVKKKNDLKSRFEDGELTEDDYEDGCQDAETWENDCIHYCDD